MHNYKIVLFLTLMGCCYQMASANEDCSPPDWVNDESFPYMEDRRGPLAPDSGLIGPGWGGIVPNRRINFVLSLGGPIRIPL